MVPSPSFIVVPVFAARGIFAWGGAGGKGKIWFLFGGGVDRFLMGKLFEPRRHEGAKIHLGCLWAWIYVAKARAGGDTLFGVKGTFTG
jgi:hypothetical protein